MTVDDNTLIKYDRN